MGRRSRNGFRPGGDLGELGRLSISERPRHGAYPATGLGQEPEAPGSHVQILSERPLAALLSPFLPECAACHTPGQNPGSKPDALGYPCSGRPGVVAPKSREGGEQAESFAVGPGSLHCSRWL